MSFPIKEALTVTTSTGGAATAYTSQIRGLLDYIVYVKDDFANGVDFTITTEDTGLDLWDEDNVNSSKVHPARQASVLPDGTALTFNGSQVVADRIAIAGERVKVVIDNGGSEKSGTFYFVYD